MQSNLVGMQAATATATTENIPNQYIVVLKPGTISAQSESMAAEAKIKGASIIPRRSANARLSNIPELSCITQVNFSDDGRNDVPDRLVMRLRDFHFVLGEQFTRGVMNGQ